MIRSPEEHFGFQLGTDRKLASWDQLLAYYRHLAAESSRVRIDDLGETTEGQPFVLLTITSENNHDELEDVRAIQGLLADPRGLDPEEAENLVERGRSIVMISCSIHATEVGAAQMAPELAYELATGTSESQRRLLDSTVLLLVPCLNPDGLERVRTWYERTLGTPYEGTRPVELYHKYVGHDNNRDWFMFTQVENRLTVEKVHNVWHPHIVFDMHQMGSEGYRFVLPPFIDPIDPHVDPALQAEIASIGTYMASRLVGEGKGGVATNVIFDAYSPSRAYQHYHGGIRILSEAASAHIATPITVQQGELKGRGPWNPKQQTWNHPLVWDGGPWTLRDIVEYQKSAAYACLEHAAAFRTSWVRNFYELSRRAVEREAAPYAYVLPPDQDDPGALYDLVKVMRTAAVEVERAAVPFEADGVQYPEGTYVIRLAQPYGAFAETMMSLQEYPDIREYQDGPPKRPYDITGHTLWLQLGLTAVEIEHPFEAELEQVSEPARPTGAVHGSSAASRGAYVIDPSPNAANFTAFALLEEGATLYRCTEALTLDGADVAAGAFVIPEFSHSVERQLVEAGLTAYRVDIDTIPASPGKLVQLSVPRIGLYKSWVSNSDEGWTRFIFESNGVPYTSLCDHDIKRGSLARQYDAIVLPSQEAHAMTEGLSEDEHPAEYCGGLGSVGAARLQEFVRQGGTLVALDAACNWAIDQLWLPVRNTVSNLRPENFYVPGSLLKTIVDTEHPIAYGMPREATVLFVRSPAFEAQGGRVVARYPLRNPLVSGFILGSDHLSGRAALVDVPVGKGHVILIGFRTQFRAQARGTYKFLFNALLNSTARRATL